MKIKGIFHFSYPLYFDNLLALINNRTNTFIISGYLGVVAVANYDVSGKLTSAANKLYTSFLLVFFPSLAGLIGENKTSEAKALMEKSMFSVSLLILPMLFTFFILRTEIITLLFSSKYADSAFALFLFSVSFYFGAISSIAGYSLVANSQTLLSFKSNFIGVISGVIISLVLTPRIGFEGAIYAVIIARILSGSILIMYLNKLKLYINFLKVNSPLLLLLPFIVLYEITGIDNLYIKIMLIALFIICEIAVFKDFRKILLEIFVSLKQVTISNIKRSEG